MKRIPVLMLAALFASVGSSFGLEVGPSEEVWNSALGNVEKTAQDTTKEWKGQAQTETAAQQPPQEGGLSGALAIQPPEGAKDLEVPGNGSDIKCIAYGKHTEKLPVFMSRHNLLYVTCREDPYTESQALEAWQRLVRKIQEAPGKGVAVGDGYRKGIGRGNLDWKTLDADRHWGDLVFLGWKDSKGKTIVTETIAVTYRAEQMPYAAPGELNGVRVDFGIDGYGRLWYVMEYDGSRFNGRKDFCWGEMCYGGPWNSPNTSGELQGLWTIRWHQLLKSWVDEQK
jgi:hypothetical protein